MSAQFRNSTSLTETALHPYPQFEASDFGHRGWMSDFGPDAQDRSRPVSDLEVARRLAAKWPSMVSKHFVGRLSR